MSDASRWYVGVVGGLGGLNALTSLTAEPLIVGVRRLSSRSFFSIELPRELMCRLDDLRRYISPFFSNIVTQAYLTPFGCSHRASLLASCVPGKYNLLRNLFNVSVSILNS